MKPRYLWLVALAAVVGAALLTATAAASAAAFLSDDGPQAASLTQYGAPPPPPPPPPGRGGLDRAVFDLDLTQAQMEQVKALRDAARSASEPYEEQVGKAEQSIRTTIESGTFDEEAIRAAVANEAKAITELRVIQARTDAGIYNLLTEEQRQALKTMRPPRRGHGREGPF